MSSGLNGLGYNRNTEFSIYMFKRNGGIVQRKSLTNISYTLINSIIY